MTPGARFETQRLRLEELAPKHAAPFLSYRTRNRAHLEHWEPAVSEDGYEPAYQEREISASVAAAAEGLSVRFLAFEKRSSDVVASINLTNIRRGINQSVLLGYSVDGGAQGRGFATEAVGAVVAFAFEKLGLHRVEASYQPINERSGRVLRKLGFVVEGYARDYLFIDNGWKDAILTARVAGITLQA